MRKRRPGPRWNWGILFVLLAAGIITALLFIAPQWLLVVTVILLSLALTGLWYLMRRQY